MPNHQANLSFMLTNAIQALYYKKHDQIIILKQ